MEVDSEEAVRGSGGLKGDLEAVVRSLRGELLALYMDGNRIADMFGKRYGVLEARRMMKIARVLVPVDMGPIDYGNTLSAGKLVDTVVTEVRAGVSKGRAKCVSSRVGGGH